MAGVDLGKEGMMREELLRRMVEEVKEAEDNFFEEGYL